MVFSCLFVMISVCLSVTTAAPALDTAPHCRSIGCCPGRDDECYMPVIDPIRDAVCYCDDFCLRTEGSDCCSDFPTVCVQEQIDMGAMVSELWLADENRIDEGRYSYNVQAPKKDYRNHTDLSPSRLYTTFDEDFIFNKGTFKSFVPLCDNYEIMQGITENNTAAEQAEVEQYLDDIMDTEIMAITTRYLKDGGYVTDLQDLREKMKTIWFTNYFAEAENDSSAFEHVFCGDIKSTLSAGGLHNWVTVYREESIGNLNYHGYTGQRAPLQLGIQYTWIEAIKPRTSFMFGVSTEFELAIFTTAWLFNPDEVTSFSFSDGVSTFPVDVVAWTHKGSEGQIASAYFLD